MSDPVIDIETASAAETEYLGAALGAWLRDGDVVLLHGDLGAGKTTLAKGVASGLRVNGVVSSPSFALVNEYDAGLAASATRLYHLDLFRLTDPGDLASIGFADLVAPTDGATLIEWPERASSALPARYLLIEIDSAGQNLRRFRFSSVPADGSWTTRLDDLRQRLG